MAFQLVDVLRKIDNSGMKTFLRILSATMFVSLLCGYASAGTIIVGDVRPPISPDRVKTYWDAPRKYDRIAIITKGSGGSWIFSNNNEVDSAIAKIRWKRPSSAQTASSSPRLKITPAADSASALVDLDFPAGTSPSAGARRSTRPSCIRACKPKPFTFVAKLSEAISG